MSKNIVPNVIAVRFDAFWRSDAYRSRNTDTPSPPMTVIVAEDNKSAEDFRQVHRIEYPYHFITADTFDCDPSDTDDCYWLAMIMQAYCRRLIGIRVLKCIAALLRIDTHVSTLARELTF